MARLKADTTEVEFIVSNRTIIRVVVAAILAIIAFAAIRRSVHTITLIGIALFLSLALDAPVQWLAARLPGRIKGSRGFATGVSIILVLAILGAFLWAIVPPLVSQTSSFIHQVPSLVSQTQDQNSAVGSFIRRHNLQKEASKLSQQLSSHFSDFGGAAVSDVAYVGSSIFSVFAVTALTVMMLAEGPHWNRIIGQLIPNRHSRRIKHLGRDMQHVIRGYVNGQVLLAVISAVLITPMLFIMHVSNPLALMVIIFVCGLIPMVGHTIGAIIVTAVALFHSVTAAIVILAYYILYQQIETYVVQPRVQANATNMSALLVFASVLLGANFGGLLGALVAIPLMGCIRVAILDYLESRDLLSAKTVVAEETPPRG
jgi:predicted PurR-regulated permease PerM